MIAMDALRDGEWYDGFRWCSGKQLGVMTMRWRARHGVFTVGGARYGLDAGMGGKAMTFEPNVISIGEPAS